MAPGAADALAIPTGSVMPMVNSTSNRVRASGLRIAFVVERRTCTSPSLVTDSAHIACRMPHSRHLPLALHQSETWGTLGAVEGGGRDALRLRFRAGRGRAERHLLSGSRARSRPGGCRARRPARGAVP